MSRSDRDVSRWEINIKPSDDLTAVTYTHTLAVRVLKPEGIEKWGYLTPFRVEDIKAHGASSDGEELRTEVRKQDSKALLTVEFGKKINPRLEPSTFSFFYVVPHKVTRFDVSSGTLMTFDQIIEAPFPLTKLRYDHPKEAKVIRSTLDRPGSAQALPSTSGPFRLIVEYIIPRVSVAPSQEILVPYSVSDLKYENEVLASVIAIAISIMLFALAFSFGGLSWGILAMIPTVIAMMGLLTMRHITKDIYSRRMEVLGTRKD